jgi:hypothetical protein
LLPLFQIRETNIKNPKITKILEVATLHHMLEISSTFLPIFILKHSPKVNGINKMPLCKKKRKEKSSVNTMIGCFCLKRRSLYCPVERKTHYGT